LKRFVYIALRAAADVSQVDHKPKLGAVSTISDEFYAGADGLLSALCPLMYCHRLVFAGPWLGDV